jgi:putative PIN family toxin of toxin-antitoxin system
LDTRSAPTRNPATASQESGATLRVVLDTNVLLSLFVFADSRFLPLRARLESGDWLALTNERCLAEFRRVLAYPMFSLDTAGQEAALSDYAALAHNVTAKPNPARPLPLCTDPDDQKFLELARDAGADCLITSDKALLKMARRNRLHSLFRILTPDAALGLLPAHARSGGAGLGCAAP